MQKCKRLLPLQNLHQIESTKVAAAKNNFKNYIMTLETTENYGQEDQSFQDNQTGNQGQEKETSTINHSITNNAEPDYGNEFNTDAFNNNELGNENPGNNEFGTPDTDEFDTEENEEFGNEELDDEGLDESQDDEPNLDGSI